jgi:hypothetical protein
MAEKGPVCRCRHLGTGTGGGDGKYEVDFAFTSFTKGIQLHAGQGIRLVNVGESTITATFTKFTEKPRVGKKTPKEGRDGLLSVTEKPQGRHDPAAETIGQHREPHSRA